MADRSVSMGIITMVNYLYPSAMVRCWIQIIAGDGHLRSCIYGRVHKNILSAGKNILSRWCQSITFWPTYKSYPQICTRNFLLGLILAYKSGHLCRRIWAFIFPKNGHISTLYYYQWSIQNMSPISNIKWISKYARRLYVWFVIILDQINVEMYLFFTEISDNILQTQLRVAEYGNYSNYSNVIMHRG